MDKKIAVRVGSEVNGYILSQVEDRYSLFFNRVTGRVWSFVKYPIYQNPEDNFYYSFVDEDRLPTCQVPKVVETDINTPLDKKERFVSFIRYVRPKHNNEIDNLQGVTFAIVLDYQEKTIKYGYSVCDGDNFIKEIGTSLAQTNLNVKPIIIPMPNGRISDDGAVADIYRSAHNRLNRNAKKQLAKVYSPIFTV